MRAMKLHAALLVAILLAPFILLQAQSKSITISYGLSPESVSPGSTTRLTITVHNGEDEAYRGWCTAVFVPWNSSSGEWGASLVSVSGVNNPGAVSTEWGSPGDPIAGYRGFAIKLETPPSFPENNPIPAGGTVVIEVDITVSSIAPAADHVIFITSFAQSETGLIYTKRDSITVTVTGAPGGGLADIVECIIEAESVYLVLPDNQGKPIGSIPVYSASVSDWTAAGYIAGVALHEVLKYDTYSDVIDYLTGSVVVPSGYGLILFGGKMVSIPVWYYDDVSQETPVYPATDGVDVWLVERAAGAEIPGTRMKISDIGEAGYDIFVMMYFTDSQGRHVLVVYGYGWQGTFAAALYFDKVVWPSISSYTSSWYVVKWVDNGNMRVDEPGVDQYEIVAQGS
ncbi:MAG: hypothetical protein DRN99_08285 [Thermoproteota archaeon]|nr:MAG: hypothetical protein DRN99_08285 [Candidatus Korarchaeota archaeon]